MDRRERLIQRYFSIGLQQGEILAFLNIMHDITISSRTLKRILSKLNLYRRKNYSDIRLVAQFIEEQVSHSGQLHGYKWMHLKCIQDGFNVTQETVRELLNIIDPTGVDIRRKNKLRRRVYSSKGPNYVWHMDSYDKLKPYGICINGCIDGYSRHIIWLRAGCTTSDPKIIAGYYLQALRTLGGCPKTIRSDMGTENGTTEKIQKILHEFFQERNSEKPCFIYGRSPANQRIESWWSILRKHNAQYWMNVFETLKEDGYFNGTFLDKSILQFCFLEIIQNDLDQVAFEWNVHKIRKSKNQVGPAGRPLILFELSTLYGAQNYLLKVPDTIFDVIEEECRYNQFPCDEDVYNICTYIMEENGYVKNYDPYDAVQLYLSLRQHINAVL